MIAGSLRWFPAILKVLTIIRPETLVRWHKAGFRYYWRWKSRSRGGRPQIETELRVLIRRMSIENPLWGAPAGLPKKRRDLAFDSELGVQPRRRVGGFPFGEEQMVQPIGRNQKAHRSHLVNSSTSRLSAGESVVGDQMNNPPPERRINAMRVG